ncbi:MAG: hypothetical protein NZ699_08040 [Roseiflexus sp.]|nr:hypothetical protein [Roseiflexus sp.]MCS7289067.1 hypothetical protein [Roseiflexus sp.]MDW8148412.1 hypothetical protein [Roseiflexaceae bacterium]MDW8232691.1 hypothetical protein [Roseiflexaceae bacterium]
MRRYTPMFVTLAGFIVVGQAHLARRSNDDQPPPSRSAEDVLRDFITCMDNHEWSRIPSYWIRELRPDLEAFLTNPDNQASAAGIFNIERARLFELKQLPDQTGSAYADLRLYQDKVVQVFYLGIDFKVRQEDKYHYNGVNYRIAALMQEEGEWRWLEFSSAPVENLVADQQGFGSIHEEIALKIHKMRRKGLFVNPFGKVLEDVRPGSQNNQSQQLDSERN